MDPRRRKTGGKLSLSKTFDASHAGAVLSVQILQIMSATRYVSFIARPANASSEFSVSLALLQDSKWLHAYNIEFRVHSCTKHILDAAETLLEER